MFHWNYPYTDISPKVLLHADYFLKLSPLMEKTAHAELLTLVGNGVIVIRGVKVKG